jgi:hypothetical protein
MNEPDVYPVGTNKFLFVPFGIIPKVSPEPDRVPIVPPAVPKLVGNVVTPLYTSRAGPGGVGSPIAQAAFGALNPAVSSSVPLDIKLVVLKLPEPDHTTSGPTCETVTVKSPVAPDVGVGVGVTVDVFVGVLVGVTVGVTVLVGVGVIVGVTVFVGVGVGVDVTIGVGVTDGDGSTNIKYSPLPTLRYSSPPTIIGFINGSPPPVGVRVLVGVGVILLVTVGVGVKVLVGVTVTDGVAVFVNVGVCVIVGVGVFVVVGLTVTAGVAVGLGLFVGVILGVGVFVGVGAIVVVVVVVGDSLCSLGNEPFFPENPTSKTLAVSIG